MSRAIYWTVGVSMFVVTAFAINGWAMKRGSATASAAGSVMLQAMERGYQCRVDGVDLEACKEAQRERWRRNSQ